MCGFVSTEHIALLTYAYELFCFSVSEVLCKLETRSSVCGE